MKKIFLALTLCSMLFFFGCDTARNPANVQGHASGGVVDYGNNIYYISEVQEDFGNTLSAFIGSHPELELVSMSSNNRGGYGSTLGYFVVFKKK